LTPRKKDKTDSAKQTRLDGGLGLLALWNGGLNYSDMHICFWFVEYK
jgi:hypothetical protein